MFADVKTGATANAETAIYHNPRISVFVRLCRYTGAYAAARTDALVAADALVVRVDQTRFNTPHVLSPSGMRFLIGYGSPTDDDAFHSDFFPISLKCA